MPTYNGAKYLEQSIQSCINQTYEQWELIIVDDASTDETPDIISRYMALDSRIRSIHNTTNRKLPGSLNIGFSQARGDYFTWTSDDNLYRPNAIAEMVTVLESHPEVALVYAGYSIIDASGREREYREALPPELLVMYSCVGACFLYRREVQEKLGGYTEDFYLAEDYDFWLRASVHLRFFSLQKNLYLYRKHGQSLTATKTRLARTIAEQVLLKHLPEISWLNRRLRAKVYLRLAIMRHRNDDNITSLKYLFKAILLDPITTIADIITKPYSGLL